jgi:hypothetical protein
MSPRPHLIQQGVVLAALLVTAALVGFAGTALTFAGLILAGAFIFIWRYRRFRIWVPEHRRSRDKLVALLLATCVLIPGTVSLGLVISHSPFNIAPPGGIWFATVALVAGVVFMSSLADWYYVLPRLSGLGRWPRPCQVEVPNNSQNWRFVTQFWYGHRLLAEFVGVGTIPATAAYIAATDAHHRPLWGVVSAVAGLGVSIFIRNWWDAWRNVQSPSVTAGSVVAVARVNFDPQRQLLYATDVDLGGIQCMVVNDARRAMDGERQPLVAFTKKKEVSSIRNNEPVDPLPGYDPPCRTRCTGINWYCANNPRAYDPN